MRRMSTAQKTSSNRLTKKRTRKDLKRRPHVRALKKAEYKINSARKQIEKLMYFRKKYGSKKSTPQRAPLI